MARRWLRRQRDPFGFQAQWGAYTDSATGLVLQGHRYYDPATARWLTRDPVGYAGGINLYAYCRNNPVNLVDQLELCGIPPNNVPAGAISRHMWVCI